MSDILISAILLSTILVSIHSFFGREIINRGIIFTDLAIGQFASLGAICSIVFFSSNYLYISSLTFALIGGSLIAIAQKRVKFLEATIGLIYSFALSLGFILLSKEPHGLEIFNNLIATDIIFITKEELIKLAIYYSLIGAILYLFYAKLSGLKKDLLFFTLFSFTIVSSVKVAGVLVVFALLLAPMLISLILKKNSILIAIFIGVLINTLAIMFAYSYDYPTGYMVVLANSFFAILASFLIK